MLSSDDFLSILLLMTKALEKHVDNVKGANRDIMINLMIYCSEMLCLNNAEIGLIFRRDRANVKRIIDKHKPKSRT